MEAEYLVHCYYNDDLSLHSLLYHKVVGNITYTCCIVPFNTEGRRATCTTRKATQAEIVLYFRSDYDKDL